MESSCANVPTIVAFFIGGTAVQVLMKAVLLDFNKPGFVTFAKFVALLLALPIGLQRQLCEPRARLDRPPLETGGENRLTRKTLLYMALPSAFGLVSTYFHVVGLLFIPVSISTMLKGSEVIFTAMCTLLVLRRRFHASHWLGIIVVMVGVMAVSLASVMSAYFDAEDALPLRVLGVAFTLLGAALRSCQIILEEYLMKELKADPFLLIGIEGATGALYMAVLGMPLLGLLHHYEVEMGENSFEAFAMLANSMSLAVLCGALVLTGLVFNVSGILVTKNFNGVVRVMFRALMIPSVWLCGIVIHYFLDAGSLLGETLTPWSSLQALGFIALVVGQATYSQRLKWPGLSYPTEMEGPSKANCSAHSGSRRRLPDEQPHEAPGREHATDVQPDHCASHRQHSIEHVAGSTAAALDAAASADSGRQRVDDGCPNVNTV